MNLEVKDTRLHNFYLILSYKISDLCKDVAQNKCFSVQSKYIFKPNEHEQYWSDHELIFNSRVRKFVSSFGRLMSMDDIGKRCSSRNIRFGITSDELKANLGEN